MNGCMMAFGLASIALCIGVFLRAKVPMFRNMLVPASVIAGVLGLIFMNTVPLTGLDLGTDAGMFANIVNQRFTLSFISIGLVSVKSSEGSTAGHITKGAWAMGILWCFIYTITPLIGMGLGYLFGDHFNFDPVYTTLVQFGFAQGPGPTVSFGTMFENNGWENAVMVGITFAAAGFFAAFGLGIPMARYAIKHRLAKHSGKLDDATLRGYMLPQEQTEYMIKDTTSTGNIETLTLHFALVGLCYVMGVGISKILALIPGFVGETISGMMFMNGMYAAYIVKWVMKKCGIPYVQNEELQSKITNLATDFIVVCSFMAVSVSVIGQWIVPILIECVVVAVFTMFACIYFCKRIGGENDLERTLALYGTTTGTVPSGISLVRIIDPEFKTTTAVELGLMNLIMYFNTPVYVLLLGYVSGEIAPIAMAGILVAFSVGFLLVLKLTGCWGKPGFSWKKAD